MVGTMRVVSVETFPLFAAVPGGVFQYGGPHRHAAFTLDVDQIARQVVELEIAGHLLAAGTGDTAALHRKQHDTTGALQQRHREGNRTSGLRASVPCDGNHFAQRPGRRTYVHVVSGSVRVNGQAFEAGDALKITGEERVRIDGARSAELLLFDLP